MKKRNDYDQDDDRVVADMSGIDRSSFASLRAAWRKNGGEEAGSKASDMTAEDRRVYLKAAIAATLVIAGVFLVACALFILFCQYVWLR